MKRFKRLQKLRCEIQKCKKSKIVLTFGVHVAILFLQNCIYLRKQPYWTTKSFVIEGIQRSGS